MQIQRSKASLFIFVFFALLGSTFLFQNCSQQNFTVSTQTPSFSSGAQKVTLPAGVVPDAQVCTSAQIKCYQKVYSPHVQDSNSLKPECTTLEGQQICYDLDITTYNTTQALADCVDCDSLAAQPGGRYNRDEYTCWVRIQSAENNAFYALKSDLKMALTDALNSCLDSLPAQGEQ